MDKQQVKKIADQAILDYMRNKQYTVSKIASHEHNGTDTIKIKRENIINSVKKTTFLVDTNTTGSPLVIYDTIPNIANVNNITFMGFVANNASTSATKRAIINGQAEIGICQGFSDATTLINLPQNVIQMCNFMYIDQTDLTKNRVGATNGDITTQNPFGYFTFVTDDTGTNVVKTVVSYANSIISLKTTLAAGWKLQGALIIT